MKDPEYINDYESFYRNCENDKNHFLRNESTLLLIKVNKSNSISNDIIYNNELRWMIIKSGGKRTFIIESQGYYLDNFIESMKEKYPEYLEWLLFNPGWLSD